MKKTVPLNLDNNREMIRKVSDQDARRSVNALAVSSHLVSALIRNPGPMGEHETVIDAARRMIKASDGATQDLMARLGFSEASGVEYKVMRVVSQAIADTWRATSNQATPSVDISRLMPVWEELSKSKFPVQSIGDAPVEDHVSMQIDLLDAMQPVLREIFVFNLLHDGKKAAVHARDVILDATHKESRSMIGEGASKPAKKQLIGALLRNGGIIYASAWRKHAEDISTSLRALSPDAQKAEIEKNIAGYSLATVDTAFRQSFEKLADLVQFLAPARIRSDQKMSSNQISRNNAAI